MTEYEFDRREDFDWDTVVEFINVDDDFKRVQVIRVGLDFIRYTAQKSKREYTPCYLQKFVYNSDGTRHLRERSGGSESPYRVKSAHRPCQIPPIGIEVVIGGDNRGTLVANTYRILYR